MHSAWRDERQQPPHQLLRGDWRIGIDRRRTELVATGLFHWVRNPVFSGIELMVAGVALACRGSHSQSTARAWGLAAGTYQVVVEGESSSRCWTGDYSLTATASAPAPANDTCATAQDVVFTNGVAVLSGSTRGGVSDVARSCFAQQADAPDVFYRVTLAQSARLRVIPTVAFNGMQVHLEAGACGAGSSAGCGTSSAFESALLAAGTYHLTVDGTELPGDFELIVQQF